ncbi:hypothetical protein DL93DRAFT_2172458 [Clavulina sp. PMI_390]|nr:hypothetical protein DL93DRAFT_2172458 [Clavulina sp. PMI_390]
MKDFASFTPFEISGEIFLAGLDLFGPNYWENDRTSAALLEYLLTLTSVSSLWRKIALNTPCLWAHIVLGRQKPKYDRPWGTIWHIQRVSAQLNRSCQTSLDVTVHALASRAHEPSKGPVWVWSSFVEKHLPRCRTIRFLDVDQCAASLFPLRGPLQRCQLLHVGFFMQDCSENAELKPVEAPQTRQFVCRNFQPLMFVSFPLEHLTFLKLDQDIWRAWMYPPLLLALSRCLSLAELELIGAALPATGTSSKPATLPLLQSLRVDGPELLSLVHAPRIVRLECSYEAIMKLGAVSYPLLAHLVLHGRWYSWDRVPLWSQSYPVLQVFEIRGWIPGEPADVFDHLTLASNQGDRFPALKILRFWPDIRYLPDFSPPLLPFSPEDAKKPAMIMLQRANLFVEYYTGTLCRSDIQDATNQLPLQRIREYYSIVPPDL